MVIRCPKCARIVPLTDLRVSWDLGTCRSCGFRFAISALRVDPVHPQGYPDREPHGVTLTRSGEQLVLRASTVAIGPAVVLGIVTVLWCGLWFLIMRGADFRMAKLGFSEFLLVLIHSPLAVLDLFKNPFPRVVLLGRHTMSFGSLLTEKQRHSMIEKLGEILAERHRTKESPTD